MQYAAVILAAGSSSRFGGPKPLVRLAGRSMLEIVAATAADAGLRPVLAVVPTAMVVPPEVVPVLNDSPEAGLSRSLRLGLGAVPAEADGAVVLLADQPTLDAATIRSVVGAAAGDRPVVAASAHGVVAPPVLIGRAAFAMADRACGDRGLRGLLAADPALVTVEVGEHAPDIDTPADLDLVAPICPGCGARVPARRGATTHPYIGASPGCWERWSELHATTGIGGLGRHANDAYAVQHAGTDGRRERQSVAIHLIGLCHWLEHGIEDPQLTELTRVALAGTPEWPWLVPPDAYPITVHDLPVPATGDDGRRWAASVWEAWSPHHALVREWAHGVLRR